MIYAGNQTIIWSHVIINYNCIKYIFLLFKGFKICSKMCTQFSSKHLFYTWTVELNLRSLICNIYWIQYLLTDFLSILYKQLSLPIKSVNYHHAQNFDFPDTTNKMNKKKRGNVYYFYLLLCSRRSLLLSSPSETNKSKMCKY